MKRILVFLTLLTSLCGIVQANTQTDSPSDSIRISLLSCSPGDVIYTLFGHTAIRVEVPTSNFDVVYNYGIFDFNTPHFLSKFILGYTDYQLGRIPTYYFLAEYDAEQRTVWEQELNLNTNEKTRLALLLEENYQPQNRLYRYNFFYDNCATRPILKIKEASKRSITLHETKSKQLDKANPPYSFRSLVHKYAQDYPWSQFGMDLLLGSEADKTIDVHQKIFAPIELMRVMQVSTIDSESLVKDSQILVDHRDTELSSSGFTFPLSPQASFGILLAILCVVSILEFKKKKTYWAVDLVFFTLYGLVGCILLFMVSCSKHPAMSPNYLLLVFHPLHLVFAPILAYKEQKGAKIWYHYANFIVLAFFIAFYWLIPQYISITILTLAASLLIRSFTYIIRQTRSK